MDRSKLPVVPATVLDKHHINVPTDDRFRACARLLQALWRERQGLPVGERADRHGVLSPFGSRIAAGEINGGNFLTPEIAQLAWTEATYREQGAVVDEARLWTNLLASQPLTLNILGLMKLDLAKATAFVRTMITGMDDAEVTGILFEHSPGRGSPALTGDHTAFDAVIVYKRGERTGFIAMEVKYSEDLRRAKRMRLSCQAAMVASNLYRNPADEALRTAPLQQITREHVLSQMSVGRGDYDEGGFVMVYPELNAAIGTACTRYAGMLAEPSEGRVTFSAWSLEDVAAALRQSLGVAYADAFERRYLDWPEVQKAIEASRPAAPAVKQLTDRRKR